MTKKELDELKQTIKEARAAYEATGKPGGPDYPAFWRDWGEKLVLGAEALLREVDLNSKPMKEAGK